MSKRMGLIHELASFDEEPPTELPPELRLLRAQWQATWEAVCQAQHAYFLALTAYYSESNITEAEIARSHYVAMVRHLQAVIAERRQDNLPVDLHVRELDHVLAQAQRLPGWQMPAQELLPYDSAIDE